MQCKQLAQYARPTLATEAAGILGAGGVGAGIPGIFSAGAVHSRQ